MTMPRPLVLIPATPASARAELRSPEDLAGHLGAELTGDWPPELYDRPAIEWALGLLESLPEAAGWSSYYFALEREGGSPVLVGAGGFKGPPTSAGEVEIGYSIVESHRRKGLATAAAEGLTALAFGDPRVRRVVAQTLPELQGSIRVLEKCGFSLTGEGDEEGVIRFELERK